MSIPNNSTADELELSVVIPIYHEEKNIEHTLHRLKRHIPVSFEVIAVYDYDEDPTVPILKRLCHDHKNLRMIKNEIARGASGALRTGFFHVRAKRILVVMADLCDDLSQIPYFLSLVPAKADIICPSRYCKGGQQNLKESPKKWIPRIASFCVKCLSGLTTYDATNSFKLYSSEVLKDMELVSTKSFSVTLEIVAKAHCLGYRIVEIPTTWEDRQFGKSHFNLMQSIVVYLPWFGLAVLGNPCFGIPKQWFRRLFAKN